MMPKGVEHSVLKVFAVNPASENSDDAERR